MNEIKENETKENSLRKASRFIHLTKTRTGWETIKRRFHAAEVRGTGDKAIIKWYVVDRLTMKCSYVGNLSKVRDWIATQIVVWCKTNNFSVKEHFDTLRCVLKNPCQACGCQEATFRLALFPIGPSAGEPPAALDERQLCMSCTEGSGFALKVTWRRAASAG